MYCKPEFTEDTLEGFRIFVVRFMIIMSKVRVLVMCFTIGVELTIVVM